ncbi:hypothetical protein [Cytobacillus sp. SAFR-174]|uniref:hypothetical protein n=1 Tax=Cytobacillus sp. SAFR-174 TaxID=3436868 RepID=UPI003F821A82
MSNQKIYILLTDTGTLFTRLIKLYTKKPYNHASISIDPELKNVYSFGRKTAKNPFIGGFVKENLRGKFFTDSKCTVISCSVTDAQLNKLKALINKIESEKTITVIICWAFLPSCLINNSQEKILFSALNL